MSRKNIKIDSTSDLKSHNILLNRFDNDDDVNTFLKTCISINSNIIISTHKDRFFKSDSVIPNIPDDYKDFLYEYKPMQYIRVTKNSSLEYFCAFKIPCGEYIVGSFKEEKSKFEFITKLFYNYPQKPYIINWNAMLEICIIVLVGLISQSTRETRTFAEEILKFKKVFNKLDGYDKLIITCVMKRISESVNYSYTQPFEFNLDEICLFNLY